MSEKSASVPLDTDVASSSNEEDNEPPTLVTECPRGYIGSRTYGLACANDPQKLAQLKIEQPWIAELEADEKRDEETSAYLVPRELIPPDAKEVARNILTFIHRAKYHEGKGGIELDFTSTLENGHIWLVLCSVGGDIPEDELPIVPVSQQLMIKPQERFRWPRVPGRLIEVPSHLDTLGSWNERIQLMNDQVAYWTNQIFFSKNIDPVPFDNQFQRFSMVRYWHILVGKSDIYKYMKGAPDISQLVVARQRPDALFSAILRALREKLEVDFYASDQPSGVHRYRNRKFAHELEHL